jgi:hypothetical protein
MVEAQETIVKELRLLFRIGTYGSFLETHFFVLNLHFVFILICYLINNEILFIFHKYLILNR